MICRHPLAIRLASLLRCPIPGRATPHERREYATRILDIAIHASDHPMLAAVHDAAANRVRMILDS